MLMKLIAICSSITVSNAAEPKSRYMPVFGPTTLDELGLSTPDSHEPKATGTTLVVMAK